jgi:orotidine-5'-phosphate decarboxylase
MTPSPFADRLDAAIEAKRSAVCLGIDPQLELFPAPLAHLASSADREVAAAAVERFALELLDTLCDLVAVVKPQVAFFERLGPPGWAVLERVVAAAHARGLLVIADAKRGDIASTAAAYADYLLGDDAAAASSVPRGLGADAMTVNAYLGADSLEPFLRHVDRGRGLYVLAKTSNPGSGDLQDLMVACERPGDGARPLYAHAAALAARAGAASIGERGLSSVGIVVGATHPEQSRALRAANPSLPFLVPGYGAQGAGPAEVACAFDRRGRGAIVNSSRGLCFAYRSPQHRDLGPDHWAEASRRECVAMRDAILAALPRSTAASPAIRS